MGPQAGAGPSAGANLGTKPGTGAGLNFEAESGRNKLLLIAGGAAVVMVLVFVMFFIFRDDKAEQLPGVAPSGPGGGPMTIEQIRTDSPVLNPARTINRARDVADTAADRNEELKNIEKDFAGE
jgi:hypothetical protein